jgi:hypothetical protein
MSKIDNFLCVVIVAARGLAEYRLTSTRSTTTLYLTLLRATGDVADWVRL